MMTFRCAFALAFALSILSSGSTFAQSQTSEQGSVQGGGTTAGNPKLVETGIPGVRALALPPAGFSIKTATDEELNAYGIPPRPNEDKNPQEYGDWLRKFSKTRIMPELKINPNVVHAPAAIKKIETKTPSNQIAYSDNWSGYVITDPTNMFRTPGTRISAVFPQPKAISGCTMGPGDYHASFWVGIDGWGSNDVLQVGTELELNCGSGVNNYGWIEWYDSVNKNPEIQITNMPVGPGDLVEADVWLEDNGFGGNAYVLLFSVGAQMVGLSLSPPPGVALIGNCVEWIAERPTVNGAYSNLTNFLLMPWFSVNTVVPANGLQVRPSKLPLTSTLFTVNMDQSPHVGVSRPLLYPGSYPDQWDDGILFVTTLPY